MTQKNELSMAVPRKFLQDEIETDLRMGIIMSYCFLKRYSSYDGFYQNSFLNIMEEYGLHYDESKTKSLPKQAKTLMLGFDYLVGENIISLQKGDYHNVYELFKIKIKCDFTNENFVILKYKDFDYVFNNTKRINKMGMLYTLLFILNHYIVTYEIDKKCYYSACGLSLETISKKLGFSTMTAYKYLKNISIEEGYEGESPLIKSKPYYIKVNGKLIRFPNIYVENRANAIKIIEIVRKEICERFKTKNTEKEKDSFDYYADFDESEFF